MRGRTSGAFLEKKSGHVLVLKRGRPAVGEEEEVERDDSNGEGGMRLRDAERAWFGARVREALAKTKSVLEAVGDNSLEDDKVFDDVAKMDSTVSIL